jgi:hypothetical protein
MKHTPALSRVLLFLKIPGELASESLSSPLKFVLALINSGQF